MAEKNLDELEHFAWGEPTFDSRLVITCHRLRKKPIDEFTVEDLRIMIGQKIGLHYLLPRAIDALEREPLAEGAYFPGDLLANVIECSEWLHSHPDALRRVVSVSEHAAELAEQDSFLQGRLAAFQESSPGRTRRCT